MRRATFEAAPVECFRHAPLSQTWRNVCAGLKAEVARKGVGKVAPTTYWVATLLQVRARVGLFRELMVRQSGAGWDRGGHSGTLVDLLWGCSMRT